MQLHCAPCSVLPPPPPRTAQITAQFGADNMSTALVTTTLFTSRVVDDRLVAEFEQQSYGVRNFLSMKPLPIELPDGRFAFVFAHQKRVIPPGYETYVTERHTTQCVIELHLAIARPPRAHFKHREQAQPDRVLVRSTDPDELMPTIRRLCTRVRVCVSTSIGVHNPNTSASHATTFNHDETTRSARAPSTWDTARTVELVPTAQPHGRLEGGQFVPSHFVPNFDEKGDRLLATQFTGRHYDGTQAIYHLRQVTRVYALSRRAGEARNPSPPRLYFAVDTDRALADLNGNGYSLKNTIQDSKLTQDYRMPPTEQRHVVDRIFFLLEPLSNESTSMGVHNPNMSPAGNSASHAASTTMDGLFDEVFEKVDLFSVLSTHMTLASSSVFRCVRKCVAVYSLVDFKRKGLERSFLVTDGLEVHLFPTVERGIPYWDMIIEACGYDGQGSTQSLEVRLGSFASVGRRLWREDRGGCNRAIDAICTAARDSPEDHTFSDTFTNAILRYALHRSDYDRCVTSPCELDLDLDIACIRNEQHPHTDYTIREPRLRLKLSADALYWKMVCDECVVLRGADGLGGLSVSDITFEPLFSGMPYALRRHLAPLERALNKSDIRFPPAELAVLGSFGLESVIQTVRDDDVSCCAEVARAVSFLERFLSRQTLWWTRVNFARSQWRPGDPPRTSEGVWI